MAQLADDELVGRRQGGLSYVLAPSVDRLRLASRYALICTVTALVTIYYATPEPALATYVVFFLNKPDRARSVLQSVALTVVVTLIIALLFGLARLVIDEPAWRVASMAGISFALLFLVSASKLQAIGGIVALVIAYALDLLGSIPHGELATRGLLYGWLFVGVPAGVSIVVNLLLAPSPRSEVQRALAQRLRAAGSALRDPCAANLDRLRRALGESDGEVHELLRFADLEHTSPPNELACLRAAADSSVALLLAVEFASTTPDARLPEDLRKQLADTFDEMADILRRGGYPVEISIDRALDASATPLARTALHQMVDSLEHFAESSPAQAAAPAKEAGGFLVPDAFTNPDHVRYALKTTAAAMTCYLVYSLLSWPGIHTSLITCYIVSLSTLGESVEKLTLRIVGCLVGAGLGLATMVFIIPSVTAPAGYLAIVFVGAFLGAWVAVGNARISYAGFQLAFALFVCVIQGAGPSFDMVAARDRIIGILLGNAVTYLIFAHVWPVSIGRKVDLGLKAAVSNLSRMLTATQSFARNRFAARTQVILLEAASNLRLSQYEPGHVRPTQGWLQRHAHATQKIAALAAPLLLFADRRDPRVTELTQRLDRLGDGPAGGPVPDQPRIDSGSSGSAGDEQLRALVQIRMGQLEEAWTPLASSEGVAHA